MKLEMKKNIEKKVLGEVRNIEKKVLGEVETKKRLNFVAG